MGSWLDALLDRGDEAKSDGAATVQLPAIERPSTPRQPRPEIKTVWFQTRRRGDNDLGAVEAGYYSVSDGVLTMHDEKGKPTGETFRLRQGDDERSTAGRLARDSFRKGRDLTDFNRPLGYSPIWLA